MCTHLDTIPQRDGQPDGQTELVKHRALHAVCALLRDKQALLMLTNPRDTF